MKVVEWVDENGRKHKAMIRDHDDEQMALSGHGILLDPPDIERIDWDAVKRDLHNMLLDRGLTTYEEVQRAQNGVTGAVVSALKRRVVQLYREVEK